MRWRQFVMDLGTLDAARVERLFARHGAEAVTFTDGGAEAVLEPARGETPLWRDTRITGLFAADTDFASLRRELRSALGVAQLPRHRIEDLAERAWEREWLRDFHAMRCGRRLWVCPAGQRPADTDAVILALDPGLAFGTGSHATTALCLEWLDGAALAGRRVLDFGCGSGILAIAALLLGAHSAHAIDRDPQALDATRRNAERNGVAARLTCGSAPAGGNFDVAVANILAQPLIEHAGWLCECIRDDGWLVLSGILGTQADSVHAAYRDRIDFTPPAARDEWVRLAGRKIARHGHGT